MEKAAKITSACRIARGAIYYFVLTFLLKKPIALEI